MVTDSVAERSPAVMDVLSTLNHVDMRTFAKLFSVMNNYVFLSMSFFSELLYCNLLY